MTDSSSFCQMALDTTRKNGLKGDKSKENKCTHSYQCHLCLKIEIYHKKSLPNDLCVCACLQILSVTFLTLLVFIYNQNFLQRPFFGVCMTSFLVKDFLYVSSLVWKSSHFDHAQRQTQKFRIRIGLDK